MSEYMKQALELAKRGAGHVSPNPMVGAVIVHDGKIIGQGWHQQYGQAHAEVNAINSVEDESLLSSSTMYVTLEPCSHWGKTPPCCDLIIEKKIPCVVVGCIDSFHKVLGTGVKRMSDAGIDVQVGDMQSECIELNKRFFKVQTQKRPYIILKWAQTWDGVLDLKRPATTAPAWLTGIEGKRLVHQWRAEEDAIMVGRNTVVMDNPSLTVREVEGRNPLRITFDQNLQLDTTYSIFDDKAHTILITDYRNRDAAVLKFASNANVRIETVFYSKPVLPQVMRMLKRLNINSLFVEGGQELLQSFIDAHLWDEARVFTSDISSEQLYVDLKERNKVMAPVLNYANIQSSQRCGNSTLSVHIPKNRRDSVIELLLE